MKAIKLAKGFLGTNNVDSNSRLCMSSAVAGYSGAFGYDGPPPAYADIALADCFLLLGTNTAACHPILWSRIRDRQAEGAFVICADPRRTPTAQRSDLHLPVRPGSDLALLSAMLHVVDRDGLLDERFVSRHTSGWGEARAVAHEWPPARAAGVCGIAAELIEEAAHRFAGAGGAMALWSMGANQSTVGTLKNRALINLCLATGQIGRPGSGPLSLTGQPNAMGGRETGGLSHLLPGYRKVADAGDRAAMAAHWGVDVEAISDTPGLPAVALFDALEAGRVKAVWIMATNPLVSLPDNGRARAALERAELVVVQDPHHPTETSSLAHAVLPAAAWPEKDGTMTSSERRIGLVRRAVAPPGEARADWQIVAGLARHLGYGDAFAWPDAAAVFDEFAACTAGRPCDMTGVSHERLRREGGVQWPCPALAVDEHPGTPRLYADNRFPTPDGRARFAPTPHVDPAETPDPEFPILLTTGRVADQWHTMTRTGHSPSLLASAGVATLSVHPLDAEAAGLDDGAAARVASRRGSVRFAVSFDDTLPRGVAFAPFHWGAMHAGAGAGTLNALTISAVDETSAQPELKAVAVRLEPVRRRDEPVARRAPAKPKRLVVVGTGMAGLAVVEEALRRRPAEQWRIVMLGEEPGPVYNRVLLSKLLARSAGPGELELRPLSWYTKHRVDLRGGCRAASLDLDERRVIDESGGGHPYDALVIATGSRAWVPPIPGAGLPHVDVFRTWRDADALAATPAGTRAVVVGGGLLGLEAAAGMHARGVVVTVVELAGHLMSLQLDAGAAAILRRDLERQGIEFVLGHSAARIESDHVAARRRTRARLLAGRRRRRRARRDDARARRRPAVRPRDRRRRRAAHQRARRVGGRRVRRAPRHRLRAVGAARRAGADRGRADRRRPGRLPRRRAGDDAQGLRRRRLRGRRLGRGRARRPRRDRAVGHAPRRLPPARARRRPPDRRRARRRRRRGARDDRAAAHRRRRPGGPARPPAARRPRRSPRTPPRRSARATPSPSARSRRRSPATASRPSRRSARAPARRPAAAAAAPTCRSCWRPRPPASPQGTDAGAISALATTRAVGKVVRGRGGSSAVVGAAQFRSGCWLHRARNCVAIHSRG